MLQDAARFWKILQDSARFYKIPLDSARFCKILQDSARFCNPCKALQGLNTGKIVQSPKKKTL